MLNNNGLENNNLNSPSKNLELGNIAGIAKKPTNIEGINHMPDNISGLTKMPTNTDPFSKINIDRQLSKAIMNSSGENLIRKEMNKGGGN